MSDFTRLENVLVKLRQREKAPGEARFLRGVEAEALLASLVAEIDETILPRRLIFTASDGVELHLAAANRRLQAFLSPVPDLAGAKDLADVAITDGQDSNLAVLGDLFRGVFSQAKSVKVDARRLQAGAFNTDIGASSLGLSKAWDVQVVEARVKKPSEILDDFLNQITEDDAEGWLRIEGEEVTDQAGSDARLVGLGEQAAVFLDGYFGKFDALYSEEGDTTATVIAPADEKGTAALFVEIGGMSAFIAAKTSRVVALAMYWQEKVAE